jgi:hypothetical protein
MLTSFISRGLRFLPLLLMACLFSGCWWYSFTGTNLSPEVKTISVGYIENRAPRINPTLSNLITEQLKDKYTKLTNLGMTDSDADLTITGEITGYDNVALAVTADEVASKNRLTITVKIKFVNRVTPRESFDNKQFSKFVDYSSTQSLDSVEALLVDEILKEIIEEIFVATVANW